MKNSNSDSQTYPEIDADGLTALVRGNNLGEVRRYFNRSLMALPVLRPQWRDLQAALQNENTALIRLLVTWGAKPTADEFKAFMAERGARAPGDRQRLQLGGLPLADLPQTTETLPAETLPAAFNAPAAPVADPYPVSAIPQEWRDLLAALHKAGAPEAIIAGGALRDTYNGRPVKDVDIFLSDRFMNKRLVKKAMAAAGLAIHKQEIASGYGIAHTKFKSARAAQFEKVSTKMQRDSYGAVFESRSVKSGAEAWTVIAGPAKTEYNIVFVKGEAGKDMKREQASGGRVAYILLPLFDIGLCQIGYDGRRVITTAAYEKDATQKILSVVRPNHAAPEHLRRIYKKYSDFALCEHARELAPDLVGGPQKTSKPLPKKKQKPAVDSYGYIQRPKQQPSSYGYIRPSKKSYNWNGY